MDRASEGPLVFPMPRLPTKARKSRTAAEPEDLRGAVLTEALRIIKSEGVGALSIRKVARNLGFSHGAPYRHFPTREHILAALTERGFELFSAALLRNLTPLYEVEKLDARLAQMCENYFAFVFENPDYYQYIFGPPRFDHRGFPVLQEKSFGSFAILTEQIRAMMHAGTIAKGDVLAVSMFVFSAMHGAASLMLNGVTEHLVADQKTRAALSDFIQEKITQAIKPP